MPRSLETTWAKLSLAAHARFLRTMEEERKDARWVVDDETGRAVGRRRGNPRHGREGDEEGR
jgi:hypothetical protein